MESNYVNYLISGLLIAFGWSGVIPAIHLVSTYEATLVMRQVAVEWIILMSFLYTASAVTYATRIPERFFPGKCDIWVSYFYNVEKFQSLEQRTDYRINVLLASMQKSIPKITLFIEG